MQPQYNYLLDIMNIIILKADYHNEQHCKDLVDLLNGYAKDPMGGGTELSDYAKANITQQLAVTPGAISILCYVDERPAGLVNCFEGFSTFECKPLLNIHDVVVQDEFRGKGICQRMLEVVEKLATKRGCCKLTMEVLQGNHSAQSAYLKYGFASYELDPKMGKAMFWQKSLETNDA